MIMKNKVLIKLIVLELDVTYDVYIPVNEVMWKIKRMLLKIVSDLSGISFQQNIEVVLMNKETCRVYDNNDIVIDTDIRNATEIIFISKL